MMMWVTRSRLRLLSHHDVMISEALTSDPLHSDMLERVSANPVLKDKVLHLSTTLQVTMATPYPSGHHGN